MFYAHNINSNNLSVKNLILLFFTIVLGFASVITLANVTIPSDISNAWQTIAKISITESGTDSAPLIEMSSWGIFIDPSILTPQTSFSWKVLWIDSNGNIIYVLSQGLVTSWGGGIGWTGDGYWTGVGSDIYNINTDNVGIGTSTMSGKLHITSSGQTEVYLEETNSGNAANINFRNTTRTRGLWWDSTPDVFYIGKVWSWVDFVITPLGFIGMGTDTPKANLQVVGTFIAGDYSNSISGTNSSIWWGQENKINGFNNFIGGWWGVWIGNTISWGNRANIVWWYNNQITSNIDWWSNFSSIVWWQNNQIIFSQQAFIGGWGWPDGRNIISGSNLSSIVWWQNNKIIWGQHWFIWGGLSNTITWNSDNSVIPGWNNNRILNSSNSFAAWYGVQILNTPNTFLWNSNGLPFQSIRTGSFIINVPYTSRPDAWGVGINTADPQALLDVNGNSIIRWVLTATGNIVTNQDIAADGEIRAKNIEVHQRVSWVSSGASCGAENPGTIIYDGTGFYGCWPTNTRKKLD